MCDRLFTLGSWIVLFLTISLRFLFDRNWRIGIFLSNLCNSVAGLEDWRIELVEVYSLSVFSYHVWHAFYQALEFVFVLDFYYLGLRIVRLNLSCLMFCDIQYHQSGEVTFVTLGGACHLLWYAPWISVSRHSMKFKLAAAISIDKRRYSPVRNCRGGLNSIFGQFSFY